MRNWQIMTNQGEKRGQLAPFTPEQLLQCKVLKGFRYREVWPNGARWVIQEIDHREQFINFDRKYPDIHAMRDRLCEQTRVAPDNHQTFLVAINDLCYFMIFTDGMIWLNTEARPGT